MSGPNNEDPKSMKIEMYKVENYLLNKAGSRLEPGQSGEIDKEGIEKADKMIEALCKQCIGTLSTHIEEIGKLWGQMRDMPESEARIQTSQKIFTLAHEVKDIGALCGYDLAAYFAESLRDYIDRTELSLKAQTVIIQAHVDALQVVSTRKIKKTEEAGPVAEELKKMVKIAVDKYS